MQGNSVERKWFSFFGNMRNKYNMRVSATKPIILFLDAKNSSKNNGNLLKESENDFFSALELASKYFSEVYNCMSLCGTDEISFIIESSTVFIDSINNKRNFRTHDIVSIFSQYFFEYFNSIYEGETVYWHCKCFNIAREKINSYIRFKSNGIQKGVTSIFLKKKGVKNAYGIKLKDKLEMCKQYPEYSAIQEYKDGIFYYRGKKTSLDEYYNRGINDKALDFFDLEEFDNL